MSVDRMMFERLYRGAQRAEDLPWAGGSPLPMLRRVASERGAAGRALDVGCGAGTWSVALAKMGYDVTSLDFMPPAIELTRRAASDAAVQLTLVQADALSWSPERPFDLVLDFGCLHGMAGEARRTMKSQLAAWTRPGGDLVLGHFGRRGFFDWRPMGPLRWQPERVRAYMAPEFIARHDSAEVVATRLPVGPTVKMATYWFERASR